MGKPWGGNDVSERVALRGTSMATAGSTHHNAEPEKGDAVLLERRGGGCHGAMRGSVSEIVHRGKRPPAADRARSLRSLQHSAARPNLGSNLKNMSMESDDDLPGLPLEVVAIIGSFLDPATPTLLSLMTLCRDLYFLLLPRFMAEICLERVSRSHRTLPAFLEDGLSLDKFRYVRSFRFSLHSVEKDQITLAVDLLRKCRELEYLNMVASIQWELAPLLDAFLARAIVLERVSHVDYTARKERQVSKSFENGLPNLQTADLTFLAGPGHPTPWLVERISTFRFQVDYSLEAFCRFDCFKPRKVVQLQKETGHRGRVAQWEALVRMDSLEELEVDVCMSSDIYYLGLPTNLRTLRVRHMTFCVPRPAHTIHVLRSAFASRNCRVFIEDVDDLKSDYDDLVLWPEGRIEVDFWNEIREK